MLGNSKGKMFLAAERGITETGWFRSYNTFNFGMYQQEHKTPFGPLYVLNDDTLAGGKAFKLLVEEDSDIILLPTVGTITYKDSLKNETLINAGEAQVFSTPAGTTIEINNPYESELINFLQLWIKRPVHTISIPQLSSFDLENNKNKLLDLFPAIQQPSQDIAPRIRASIGKFTGRKEVIYNPYNLNNGLFMFVLEGAFEVQHRLMEARDGLALWNSKTIEIEALSNDAIILIVEICMQTEFKTGQVFYP